MKIFSQIFAHRKSGNPSSHVQNFSSTLASQDVATTEKNRREAEERLRVISDFGSFIERNPSAGDEIRDSTTLPHPKRAILDAIYIEMACETDSNRLRALSVCALSLADYQPGVGARPLSSLGGALPTNTKSLSSEEIRALAAQIAYNPDRERFDKFKALADQDVVEILKMLKAAELTRQQMFTKRSE